MKNGTMRPLSIFFCSSDMNFSFLLQKSIRNRIADSTGSSRDSHAVPRQTRVFHWEYTLSTISINWIASSTPQVSIGRSSRMASRKIVNSRYQESSVIKVCCSSSVQVAAGASVRFMARVSFSLP